MTKRGSSTPPRIGPPRTVVHWTPDINALIAFVQGDDSGKRLVLERLTDSVLSGYPVNPTIQMVANAIMAEAILKDTLPGKKAGRPKADAFNEHEAAYVFFELHDAGMSRGDALRAAGQKFCCVERQVERFAKKYRSVIGWNVEDRERYRLWRQVCEASSFEEYEGAVRIHLKHLEGLSGVDTKPSSEQLLETARRLLDALKVEECSDIKTMMNVVGDIQAP